MAQQKSAGLIIACGLVLVLAAAWPAAGKTTESVKYPPITGKVHGQLIPGVLSLTINGATIEIKSDLSFDAPIKLKAGEKYLTLKLDYGPLRIVKKYEVRRQAKAKSFSVYVAKSAIKRPEALDLPAEEKEVAAFSEEQKRLFPPITGEISGAVVPGVRSITANDQPVTIGPDQTFQTDVGIKAGEKYLTLALNFDDYKIVKKYKVLRPDTTEKFKVFVTKNEVVAAASSTPAPFVPEPASVPGKATVIPEKANIVAVSMTLDEPEPALEEAVPTAVTTTRAPVATVVEQKGQNPPAPRPTAATATSVPTTVTTAVTVPSTIVVTPTLPPTTMAVTTTLRPTTTTLPAQMADETQAIEPEPEEYAPEPEKEDRPKKLKRYVRPRYKPARRTARKITIPVKPQAKPLLIRQAVKPPANGKSGKYQYVWEFSRGKLLALKKNKGSYSADIFIPAKNQWLSLKDLSEPELKALIEDRSGNFKAKGK